MLILPEIPDPSFVIRTKLFDEQISRKPNHYPWTDKFVKAMHDNPWSDSQFTFQSDLHDFKVNMTSQMRNMTTRNLSIIGQVEIEVKTFWGNLGINLPQPCFIDLGYAFANVEVIHNNAYERLLTVLGIEDIYEENLKLDIFRNRVKYLKKHNHRYYKDSKKQYLYALILFTLYVENVSLFSSFYVIFYFQRFHGMLKDASQQVSYTAKEETIHAFGGINIINEARDQYPEIFDEEFTERIRSSVKATQKAEAEIGAWGLDGYSSDNLSADILDNLTKSRLNESLEQIGFEPVFDDVDEELLLKTLWFEEDVVGSSVTDFFYQKPVEYTKNDKSYDDINFDMWKQDV